ncbi:N-6 DNA methylase [Streptomyces caniscabiei]|uniref:N-6 DNA methylase n=1 Tax=Streptomyces caniscabiei TaxID=2746961 RepID=A0ABU4MV48_9ACTN|nr:N-6 DNA methylase [Streptomyces caniscabiei]MBE4740768.1 N-6 DNA methylase [Streptomyces caniscabiei]MBE4759337.1 N-6 DNA methylase [Streptomyces caniscabiei]MBE4769171.1 N-6 DNA methylase [Streptomyces caniscabiei]MBE4788897.1 N-6 DNA methylase [Streptomyces caniscabiei]MBE4797978.1 N-6 DNA methylase [Streptomyces caniscabiei]
MADHPAPSAGGSLVTGSEIARLAGVTRAAVSNWRRRYEDFPAPAGGGTSSPLFDLTAVQAWLDRQHKGQDISAEVQLWQALRAAYGDDMIGGLTDVAQLLADSGGRAPDALPTDAVRLALQLKDSASPGDVVSALTGRFTDSVRRAGSDQVTSPRIVHAVRHFAGEVPAAATLFDPACGIGTLLLTVGPKSGVTRRGQEVDARSARFTQLRADLMGFPGVDIGSGDSLRDDHWPNLKADLVVCDPPVGSTDWGREELLLDPRWEFGTPSRAEAELAWLQHAYAHTAPGGRVLMVMPASVAYRKAGRRIRAELVRRGILTRIIALPAGSAASHALPVHLWHLRRPRFGDDVGAKVRMVNLTANDPDSPLEPSPDQIADVPLVDLLDDAVDLTPGRHVQESRRDYATEYRVLRQELAEQLEQLVALLPALMASAGPSALDGPSVSVADLARAGLVEYGDPEPISVSDQLDTDYLQGFLRSAANTRRSTSASGTYRLDGKGARIPQMDIAEQRRYGAAFRALQEFEERVRRVAELSREATALARDGLGNGALAPEG